MDTTKGFDIERSDMVVKLYGNAFRLVMIPFNNAGAARSGRAVRGVQMPPPRGLRSTSLWLRLSPPQ